VTDTVEANRRRAIGMVVAAVPSVSFVVANAASSLDPAIVVAACVALAVFVWEVARHRSLWHATAGLVVVAACAGVAASTGQARGFFLLPMLVPFTVVVAGLGSLAAGKPLTGLLLNRISGGPPNWATNSRLYRAYANTTWATIVFHSFNAALQVTFYRANETIALGVLHVATAAVSAGIVAVTVVTARRAVAATRPVGPPPSRRATSSR
jgi:hypothetical protein